MSSGKASDGLADSKADQLAEYIEEEVLKDYCNNANAEIRNPLSGLSEAELNAQVVLFCDRYGFNEKLDVFQKAAQVAQKPWEFEDMLTLTDEDKYYIRRETTRKSTSYG